MNRIKELRTEKGITVKDLSDVIGISQSMLSNYENGNSEPRNQEIWDKLASFFGVSVPYLRGFETKNIDTSNIDTETLIERMLNLINLEDEKTEVIFLQKKENKLLMNIAITDLEKLLGKTCLEKKEVNHALSLIKHRYKHLDELLDTSLKLYNNQAKSYSLLLDLLKK